MATAAETVGRLTVGEESAALAASLRRLTRVATWVAAAGAPALFIFYLHVLHWAWYWAALVTFGEIVAFRGLVDIFIRRLIPWPTLFGSTDARLTEEDIVNRRRSWFCDAEGAEDHALACFGNRPPRRDVRAAGATLRADRALDRDVR